MFVLRKFVSSQWRADLQVVELPSAVDISLMTLQTPWSHKHLQNGDKWHCFQTLRGGRLGIHQKRTIYGPQTVFRCARKLYQSNQNFRQIKA